MKLHMKYLVTARDRTGKREEVVSLPAGSTLRDLSEWLQHTYGLKVPDSLLMATLNGKGWNQYPEALSTILKEDDTVCLFPPISGG
jgi:molybdopterin converting factor small subunit